MFKLNFTKDDKEIPYDLKAGNEDSTEFYEELDRVTNKVIRTGIYSLKDILSELRKFLNVQNSDNDILLDLLIAGILWQEYAGLKIRCAGGKGLILRLLYYLRRYPHLKNQVDIYRGRLAVKWLKGKKEKNPSINFVNLKKLITYLESTCEYNEEMSRLKSLRNFLVSLEQRDAESTLKRIVSFASWFKNSSAFHLGHYTSGVSAFLSDHSKKYSGREDFFFCGRKESEYHINMVGAQIMNRSLAEDFSKTEEKILLLPTCMASQGTDCRARLINGELRCTHCTSSCNISQTSKVMGNKGIRTVLIKHSSSFSRWLEPWSNQKKTGLIGVACVLNLLSGGFEMKRLGIPSQCVFLDHAGCKKHWRGEKASELNTNQVCNVLCSSCQVKNISISELEIN